jgi:serine/threonine protein kinase
MPLSAPVPVGTILENRYEVVRFLGHGGFGRTYLVKDQHRFQELCVLKEFAPQVSQAAVIQKAEELFQREAGTLYKLEHPQIPEFRAMSSVQFNGEKVVFLVEQFIDGYNYGEWVEQGHCLTEAQGLQLLRDLLPVLRYLHSQGVIHRDIAPDNIMCDRTTNQPILIDFGSVKQVTQTALQMVGGVNSQATQIHKPGYTPMEQIKGEVHPNSDLYALAVTVLVLMTGQPPTELFDAHYQVWNWQKFVRLDHRFENVLYRMLGRHTSDRYGSADAVLQALSGLQVATAAPAAATAAFSSIPVTVVPPAVANPSGSAPYIPSASPAVSTVKTVAVAPLWNPPPPTQVPVKAPAPVQPAPVQPAPAQPVGYSAHAPTVAPSSNPPAIPMPVYVPPRPRGNWLWRSIKAILLLPFRLIGAVLKLIWGGIRLVDMMFTWLFRLVMIAVVVGLFAIGSVFGKPDWLSNISLPSLPSLPGGSVSANSSKGCEDLQGRAERSGLTYAQLNQQINQKFHQRHPQLKGRALSNSAEDQGLRDTWCEMADQFLDRAERK